MDTVQEKILEQITRGSVSIDSLRDVKKFFKRFPNDPLLLKASADLMIRTNKPDEAALLYAEAAASFLKAGKLLSAIVSIAYSWHIKTPTYQQAQLFLSAMRDGSIPITPLKIFLDELTNPEVLAVVKSFENVHLSENKLLQKADSTYSNLYFIVSGRLKEVCYQPSKIKKKIVYKQSIVNLSSDDSIGNLYPLKEENECNSYIETITPVELVKLSKKSLLQLCTKYPNVEQGLQAVNVFRNKSKAENILRKERKGIRHQIETEMTIEIYPQSFDNFPIVLWGYSKDISIGGACIVLDAKNLNVTKSVSSFNETIKNSKVKINFPAGGIELKVSGKIVWTKKIIRQKEKTLELGIQFQELSPKLRGMLFVFADNSKKKGPAIPL